MAHKVLQRGARGAEVEKLQTLLNRVGAMLLVDRDFGGGTERAVKFAQQCAGQTESGIADAALWTWLEAQPEPFPALPANGVAFIAVEETGGLQYYNSHTCYPHFPGEKSGITIGVGYDLRMNTLADFRRTWRQLLPRKALQALEQDIGKPGSKRRVEELKAMGVIVPFQAAWPVFTGDSMPRYYALTRTAYPSLDQLPGPCRTALVSLVFNRGQALSGKNREEMAEIRRLLDAAEQSGQSKARRRELLAGVEDQLVGMKRLWPATSGLVKRRQSEANLWRQGLSEL
jgi:hypothetical protein